MGDPALAQFVNGSANAVLAAFLSPFVAINFTQAPQINLVIGNLQSALLGLGEWIEDAIFVLFIVLINIIELIGWIFTMQGAAAPRKLSAAFGLRAQGLPLPVPLQNITGLVILQKVLEAPWLGVVTNTINFGLALLNNTWSLTLLITNAKLNTSDLAYFQVQERVFPRPSAHASPHRWATSSIGYALRRCARDRYSRRLIQRWSSRWLDYWI